MYTYTYGGKGGQKRTLAESNDRVVVRTKNSRSLHNAVFSPEGKDTLKDFNVEVEFPEADVTVLKAKEAVPGEKIAMRDKARSVLKEEEEIRFAGRVLVDENSQAPVLYTENLFVKFHDSVKADTCEKILAENNLVIKQKLTYAPNTYFAGAPENTGLKVFEIAEALLERNEVELCHPELIRKKSLKAIHPEQWHLKPTTINGISINAGVNAEAAHLVTKGEGITIAIIDDGFDIDHVEFNIPGKVVSSRDVTLGINNPRPKFADETHGTACCGVAAAAGITASGVAPGAFVMPIRSRESLGSIAEGNAFKWAVDHGADIISCSWGPDDGKWFRPADPLHTHFEPLPDSTRLAIEDAVTRGRNGKGCVIFFAAGNGNEDVQFDGYASFDKVIAVAASNDTDKRSVYSDFGDRVWCCFPSSDFGHLPFNHPEPKTSGIFTTDLSGVAGDNPIGGYVDDFGGTSSACPGAAGTAALILSVNPDLTWQEVRDIIRETAEKIDTAGGQYDASGHSRFYGYGKVNALEAVNKAISMKAQPLANSVKIISALVDPAGQDAGNENISILNTSAANVNISNWSLEVKGKRQVLNGLMNGGQAQTIVLDPSHVKLSNKGATIRLLNEQEQTVNEVTYTKSKVKKGITIQF